ncbi:hypothetical protein Acsp03_17650 [Actinomadura sp. NBRC 104412]|uniref:hypothetical protein n=1 Tax=Actinomadura sp. NBRC 104412 TaxID=3032203 RepID=UPI0024A2AF9A|nr:hypothetical protein [Actinomadura sp. NBRC 104412]GLZ04299.1 hypothetical protein Acsp03_17650 [Actinomadura sp. NBRC 104412]
MAHHETPPAYGRVPTRVLLCGDANGWHYTVMDQHGTVMDEHGHGQRVPLRASGVLWESPSRHDRDPEPPWWRRHLDETAQALRDHVGQAVTDRTFADLGAEAEIAWFAVEEPTSWEGLITLVEPDPARFPGRVPPFVVTLQPGRGALLPDAHLLFSTLATDAWTVLAAVSERCRTPPPRASFLCGWEDHRSVRIGRGGLGVSTMRADDGTERIGEIHVFRGTGWGGNPGLRLRLDGIDLLDEPARDVAELLRGLGHEVVPYGRNGIKITELG